MVYEIGTGETVGGVQLWGEERRMFVVASFQRKLYLRNAKNTYTVKFETDSSLSNH